MSVKDAMDSKIMLEKGNINNLKSKNKNKSRMVSICKQIVDNKKVQKITKKIR